jgi:hypothetical protein
MVSVRHIVTTIAAHWSLSAGFLRNEADAEGSTNSGRRLAVARVPSRSPGATPFTIRPRPCAFMAGATAFMRHIAPVRLMAMILSYSSNVMASRFANGMALL